MDASIILADLRARYGNQSVLYVEDLAEELDKSEDAVRALNSRNGLPFDLEKVGGKLAISIFDYADWLANPDAVKKPKKASDKEKPEIAAPARKRKSLGVLVNQFQMQAEFLSELSKQIEKRLIASETAATAEKDKFF